MAMSDNTILRLVDMSRAAIESDDMVELRRVELLLRMKCSQAGVSWLAFLAKYVFSVEKQQAIGIVDVASCCPYCEKELGSSSAMKAHLGRKHADKKSEWSGKY